MSDMNMLPYLEYVNMTEILFKDSSGTWISTEKANQKDLGLNSIGFFLKDSDKAGTGFVIKVLNDPPACAIILTAAHIFFDFFVFVPKNLTFVVENQKYLAIPLQDSLSFDNKKTFFKDPISKHRISVPSDYCICILHSIPGEVYTSPLIPLTLCEDINTINENYPCFVIGYPLKIRNWEIYYVAPSSLPTEYNVISACIHNGEELALSRGKVIKCEEMCCVSCPSANGMSGSPVIVETATGFKVIGILHGGPAGFLHKPIALTVHKLMSNCGEEGIEELLNFIRRVKEERKAKGYDIPIIIKQLKILLVYLKENLKQCKSLDVTYIFDLMGFYKNCLREELKMGAWLNYNLCLPVSRFYDQVNEVIQFFN